MAHFVFGTVLVAMMLSVPFVAISSDEASAQQRATCSQARLHCGTQHADTRSDKGDAQFLLAMQIRCCGASKYTWPVGAASDLPIIDLNQSVLIESEAHFIEPAPCPQRERMI
jgi:hypothetical protein